MEDYDYPNEFNHTDYEHGSEQHLSPAIITRIVGMALFAAVGLVGNITVVSMISWQPRLRASVTNVYLLQRAVADIIHYCFLPMMIMGYSGYHIHHDNMLLFCTMTFMSVFGTCVSAWMLVLVTVDCYLASRPQHHTQQYRWKVLKITSGLTWPVGTLVAIVLSLSINFHVYSQHTLTTLCFLTVLVPLIICWVFVSFLYPPKSTNTVEGASTSRPLAGESEGNTVPPKVLILALITALTVLRVPPVVFELLMLWDGKFHNEYAIAILFSISDLEYAVTPMLYIWLQKDLKQCLMKCWSRRKNSPNILLDSR